MLLLDKVYSFQSQTEAGCRGDWLLVTAGGYASGDDGTMVRQQRWTKGCFANIERIERAWYYYIFGDATFLLGFYFLTSIGSV